MPSHPWHWKGCETTKPRPHECITFKSDPRDQSLQAAMSKQETGSAKVTREDPAAPRRVPRSVADLDMRARDPYNLNAHVRVRVFHKFDI